MAQFEAFKASSWAKSRGLRPVRTELCVGWRDGDRSISAGQIDALYVDRAQRYYLFDFKRVAKNHKLDPKDKGFTLPGEDPPMGVGPMAHLPDTHYQRYSLQTSIYNLMMANTHGVDVGDRMYLLRMHTDRAAYELVQCRDLRNEAREALRSEAERLAARPPPPPPAASPATASPPPDVNGAPPAPAGSGTRKRPAGAAPSGKVWLGGRWVDARRAKKARTPTTEGTLKPRPEGKAPAGKKWDGVAGVWVALGGRFCKHASPPVDGGRPRVPLSPRNVRQRGH